MIRATILGCGSSGGIPRLGGHWGDCDPENPKNRRRRCSLMVERIGEQGITRLIIDTGPDFVAQLLDAKVGVVDAVLYTHPHADHLHGIDDIRQLAYNTGEMVPVWADEATGKALQQRFGYIFETPAGSLYPPVCEMNRIEGNFVIRGDGGVIKVTPFTVEHGRIDALGFRLGAGEKGGLVYLPDVSAIPDAAWPIIRGADVFICDALRRTPHPSHSHLSQTLGWFEKSSISRCIITNMHLDMDYQAVMADTPDQVVPAYDGMVLEIE